MKRISLKAFAAVSISIFMTLTFPAAAATRALTVGSIDSKDPGGEVKKFLPFARYLAVQLKSEGVEEGKIAIARSIQEMAKFMKEGKVDIFIDSPFPAIAVSRLAGSKLLARRWKKGVAEYRSIIFARKDGNIKKLSDLNGKIIAFEEPYSSSGYFFPKTVLRQKEFKLSQKYNPQDSVSPDEIGYVFSYDDESTMVWVLKGKAQAGSMDDQNYKKLGRRDLDKLLILYKSSSLPRHVVSCRSDLPEKLAAKIKEILFQMDKSEEGRNILKNFEKTAKFDELPKESEEFLLESAPYVDAEFEGR